MFIWIKHCLTVPLYVTNVWALSGIIFISTVWNIYMDTIWWVSWCSAYYYKEEGYRAKAHLLTSGYVGRFVIGFKASCPKPQQHTEATLPINYKYVYHYNKQQRQTNGNRLHPAALHLWLQKFTHKLIGEL